MSRYKVKVFNQQLVRTNSATKIQAHVRGRQSRSHPQTKKDTKNKRQLARKNSATKIQTQVRGHLSRAKSQASHRETPSNIETESNYDSDNSDFDDDPILKSLEEKVKKLQNDYRRFRHNREQGKMQLTLLDYDIAKMELKNARAYRLAAYRRQQNKERNGMVALVCLPCLLCCQFLCCVSTAATGERRKTVRERDKTISKLKSLGKDLLLVSTRMQR
jgi:hypothetical protein